VNGQGHATRVDRGLSMSFGSENIAIKELVAELGTAFPGAEFQIKKAR